MLKDLLLMDLMSTQDEFDESLKFLSDAKKFGKLDEYVNRTNEILKETNEISRSMYSAWYDLFINSDTGKLKEEIENMLPKPGRDTIY